MTPAQVAKLIGCHPGTIRQRIREGVLSAVKNPARKSEYRIQRDSLVLWLRSAGWSGAEIRRSFPMEGPLILAGIRPELRPAFAFEPTRIRPGLFGAAIAIAEFGAWGLVIDLPMVGTARACEELKDYSVEVPDRPLLIGIHGDDFADSGGIFDAHIPDGLPVSKIAQRIRALRPWS